MLRFVLLLKVHRTVEFRIPGFLFGLFGGGFILLPNVLVGIDLLDLRLHLGTERIGVCLDGDARKQKHADQKSCNEDDPTQQFAAANVEERGQQHAEYATTRMVLHTVLPGGGELCKEFLYVVGEGVTLRAVRMHRGKGGGGSQMKDADDAIERNECRGIASVGAALSARQDDEEAEQNENDGNDVSEHTRHTEQEGGQNGTEPGVRTAVKIHAEQGTDCNQNDAEYLNRYPFRAGAFLLRLFGACGLCGTTSLGSGG